MKSWPENPLDVSAWRIIDEMMATIKEAYVLQRRHVLGECVKPTYGGWPIRDSSVLAASGNIVDRIKWDEDDEDELFRRLIFATFQLGIDRGIDMHTDEIGHWQTIRDDIYEMINTHKSDLKRMIDSINEKGWRVSLKQTENDNWEVTATRQLDTFKTATPVLLDALKIVHDRLPE